MAAAPKSQTQIIGFVEDLKRQWMATIDALIDPLMIVGNDYVIQKANKAMATRAGVHVRDIVGKKCHQVFAKRSTPCPGCKMKTAAKSHEAQTFALPEIIKDKHFEATSQPIFDTKGKLEGVVQVYRDRTEAKNLERQLLQNEKLASIGLLAGGIAHEINNPLGGIMIFAQMLLREIAKDDPHYKDVDEIHNAAQRCKAIVENLLDFARQRPARNPAKEDEIDVVETVKTALRFAKVGLHRHDVQIDEDWQVTPVPLTFDRNKAIQLFLNLIQNALQAMPDGGHLRLRSFIAKKSTGDVAVVEIEDTGVGIGGDDVKKIFDPFFTTKEPGEGTGLGLAICYGIVQDMGGHISVKSAVNHGSTFRLEIPAQRKRLKKPA